MTKMDIPEWGWGGAHELAALQLDVGCWEPIDEPDMNAWAKTKP
jgi:hypothetical protein